MATLKFVPGPGLHSYTAAFGGAATNSASSTANAQALTVTAAISTQTTLSTTSGQSPFAFGGTVTASSGAFLPTGSVSLLDTTSNTSLGSATLSTGTAIFALFRASTPATATEPSHFAVADFNGDGKPDIAIPNPGVPGGYGGGPLTILLGNGDGTYTATTHPATATNPSTAVTADFNGDGKPDLLVDGGTGGALLILLGNGDGTFTAAPASSPAITLVPFSVAIGDFNGDGKPDLAITNFTQSGLKLTILLGNGNGTFTATAAPPAGATPSFVAIADFNGDGKPDLAVLSESSIVTNNLSNPDTITILLGNGDGAFTANTPIQLSISTNEASRQSIAVGDFDGDGKADLAVNGWDSNTPVNVPLKTFVLVGHGDGTFVSPNLVASTTGINGYAMAVGDFNGDGKDDLATGDDAILAIRLSNGDGTFTLASSATGATTHPDSDNVAIVDVNGDGVPDLIQADSDNQFVGIYLVQRSNNVPFTFTGIAVSGTGVHNLEASYGGDSIFGASISSAGQVTASPLPTTLTLTSSANSVVYGAQIILTATLSPSSAGNLTTNGETVTFSNNGTSIGTATLSAGVATLNVTSLPVGSYSLTASYAGDNNFVAAVSTPVSVVINESILLSSSPSNVAYNGTVTLAATANPTISGGKWWIFRDTRDGTLTQYVLANGAFPNGPSNGFVIATQPLSVGTHTFYAYYSATPPPNNQLPPNQVVSTSVTVTKAGSTTGLTSSATSIPSGTRLTFTATIASSASGTPTGTVQFLDGAIALGSGSLNSGGVATFSTSTLAVGTHNITAAYSGDSNFTSSSSVAITVTVANPVPVATVTPSTLTFVSQAVGTTSASQTVTLSNSGQAPLMVNSITASGDFAQTNNCGTSVAAGANCTISVAFTPTAAGGRNGIITITDNATGSPQTVVLSGTGVTFAVTSSSNALTASPGGSTTATIQVAPVNGFTGSLNLTCAVNYQGQSTPNSPPSCSLNPPQVQISGTSPISSTLTVSTTAATARLMPGWALKGSGVALAVLILGGVPRRRWRGNRLLAVLCLVAIAGMSGCSGSSSSGSNNNPTNSGTTKGSYQVVVKATSGSATTSTTIPLTIQ